MSDINEGQGWWIASDGNWYPPELHPSVREAPKPPVPTKMTVPVHQTVAVATGAGTGSWHAQPEPDAHVGPHFPDLFQKALQGSHLVDNVTVMHAADDSMVSNSFSSSPLGSSTPVSQASGGGNSKRRWRKGR
jgi:hypothetical protein